MNYLILGLLFCSAVYFGLPYLIKRLSVFFLRMKCRKKNAIVLTYDDGPDEELTPRLLEILSKYNANATFFVLSHKIQAAQKLLQKMKLADHEIASHSFAHKNAWTNNPFKIWSDTEKGLRRLESICGGVSFYRPPYGKLTLPLLLQIYFEKVKLVLWTIDSTDTSSRSQSIETILDQIRKNRGGVVLMHDFQRTSKYKGREGFMLDLTEAILGMASEENLEIYRLRDLI